MDNVNEKKRKNLFYFLLLLVILRPSLDIFADIDFQIQRDLPSINLNTIIGGAVFVLALFFILKNFKKIPSIPLFWPILFFVGFCFLSVFYSVEPIISIREFIRLTSIFLLYFLVYLMIKNKSDWQLLLKVILASYILPGSVAIIQLIGGYGITDDFGGFNRIYGTFAHSNSLALYTLFILGLIIPLIFSSGKNKNYLIISALMMVILLFFTYSRSGLACFLFFLLVFGLFKHRKIIFVGIIIFLLAYFFSDVFQQRFWELVSLDPYGSVVWRLRFWQDMLPISLWQPWFGYGLSTFETLAEFYRGFNLGSLEAHNDFLKILTENGVFGLIAYLWLYLALFFCLIKAFLKSTDSDKFLSLGILVITLCLFFASAFDNILRTTALQWNLWILLGGWLKRKNF